MTSQLAQIAIPEELLREIDAEVGVESRSAFLVDTLEEALRRRRFRAFLQSDEPAWKDEDHPDLVEMGTKAWVRALRQQSERHFPDPAADESPAA